MATGRLQGFVLILTMMVIATSALLISLVINRVSAYRHLSKVWIDVEKARLIARGGVEIAMSRLAQLDLKAGQ